MVLNDGMSAVLKRITSALDTTLNAFEQVQRASGRAVDAAQIAQARSQLVGANAEIQEMADGYRRAAEQEENLNRGLHRRLPGRWYAGQGQDPGGHTGRRCRAQ